MPVQPTIQELIEDFGWKSNDLCIPCRTKGRFNMLVRIKFSPKVGDWYLVCPYCDTSKEDK